MIKFGTGGWRAIIGEDFIKSTFSLLQRPYVLRSEMSTVRTNLLL